MQENEELGDLPEVMKYQLDNVRLPMVFWAAPLMRTEALGVRSPESLTTQMLEDDWNQEFMTGEVKSDTFTDVYKSFWQVSVHFFANETCESESDVRREPSSSEQGV